MGMKFRSNSTGPALAFILLLAAAGTILTIMGLVEIVRLLLSVW